MSIKPANRKKPVRIYVGMVADLLQPKSLEFLERARSLGDELVVGVCSDADAASSGRQPIMRMEERAAVLKACRYVDAVIPNVPLHLTPEFLNDSGIDYVCPGGAQIEEEIERYYGAIRAQGRVKGVRHSKEKDDSSEITRRMLSRCKVGFISKPVSVDFFAGHALQAQAGSSVFKAMSRHHNCRWLFEKGPKPTGVDVAVLLDHTYYHQNLKKTPEGYKYLFHLSHDLGDLDIYKAEKKWLRGFDILFVPGPVHLASAREAFGPEKLILEVGWPKFDEMEMSPEYRVLADKLAAFSREATILYAPTDADNWEWKEILPLLAKLDVNVIVKNHIYVNPGQAFLEGVEEATLEALRSAKEMEAAAKSYNNPNFIVAPREMNICSLFPFADVLISDQSSVNLEFLGFGICIETGRFGRNPADRKPSLSQVSDDVLFKPIEELVPLISNKEAFREFMLNAGARGRGQSFVKRGLLPAGEVIAHLMDNYLFMMPPYSESIWSRLLRRRKVSAVLRRFMPIWSELLRRPNGNVSAVLNRFSSSCG